MSKWSDIYKTRICNGYIEYCRNKYSVFTSALTRYNDALVSVELGCGAGTFTKILLENNASNRNKCYILVDSDKDMLELAKLNLKQYLDTHIIKFVNMDILDYKITTSVDTLVFSHGVLEHLLDEQIKDIRDKFSCKRFSQVHYVPTDKYEKPSYGDERLLPVYKWKTFGFKTLTFNDGFDLMLRY